jgi:hypothetical protein
MNNETINATAFFTNGNYYIEVKESMIPNYPEITSGSFTLTIEKLGIDHVIFHYKNEDIIDIGNNVRKSLEQCLPSQSYGNVFIKINKDERVFMDIIKFSKMRLANIMRNQRDTSGVKIFSARISFN